MQNFILVSACLALTLSACEGPPTREQAGMVIGGVVGGVAGSELGGHGTVATIVGTIAGAAVGGLIGKSMDESDRRRTARALETLPTGRASRWVNPDSGASYVVTPTRTYERRDGPCRDYTVDAMIAGRPDRVVGTACRQPDGSWRVQP